MISKIDTGHIMSSNKGKWLANIIQPLSSYGIPRVPGSTSIEAFRNPGCKNANKLIWAWRGRARSDPLSRRARGGAGPAGGGRLGAGPVLEGAVADL